MRVLTLLSLMLFITACGASRSSKIKMGETTRADLIAEKGEGVSESKVPVSNDTVIIFADGDHVQLKNDVVKSRFSDPVKDEKSVLWWKHKFKNCTTKTRTLAQAEGAHTPPQVELSCPEEGLSIIYTEGSDLVSRVVEFEK